MPHLRRDVREDDMRMMTSVEKHMVKTAAKEELQKLLLVVRDEGCLHRSADEPCAALMTSVVHALEKIEKEWPGALAARRPQSPVPALRRIAALCVEAERRERSRSLSAPLGAVAKLRRV